VTKVGMLEESRTN